MHSAMVVPLCEVSTVIETSARNLDSINTIVRVVLKLENVKLNNFLTIVIALLFLRNLYFSLEIVASTP